MGYLNKEIWVVVEHDECRPARASFELLSKAFELAESGGGRPAAVVVGKSTKSVVESLRDFGVGRIYSCDAPALSFFDDESLAEIIARIAERHGPGIILGAATVRGRSLMPRVAVLLRTGLTADCTMLETRPDDGRLLQTRPAFGGNILATIVTETFPQMATVRPHVFKAAARLENGGAPELVDCSDCADGARPVKTRLASKKLADSGNSLADAQIVVAAGMGVGGPKGLELVFQLAGKLGAAVGASRSVVDSGWLDYSRQVGQTGLTVHPKIYIACGVSGAIQHQAGMQNSDFIIAVNSDPSAPIFDISDVCVRGSVFDVIPALCEKLG